MNYSEYIDNILSSRPNKAFAGSEMHHIVPRCSGGTEDKTNKIYLTPDEHFTAHKLLADENPDDYKLFYALFRMCDGRRNVTPEDYAKIRLKMSEIYSDKFKGSGNPFYGKQHSQDTKHKLSDYAKERFKVEDNPFLGKKHSKESKQKMSESHKKQIWIMLPDGTQSKMIYKSELQEYLDKGWVKGRPRELFLGEKNPFHGKHRPENVIYNKVCKICRTEFVSKYPGTLYCENCKIIKMR